MSLQEAILTDLTAKELATNTEVYPLDEIVLARKLAIETILKQMEREEIETPLGWRTINALRALEFVRFLDMINSHLDPEEILANLNLARLERRLNTSQFQTLKLLVAKK